MKKLISDIESKKKIGEGLVHNIFMHDNLVYKVPKKGRIAYKDEKHFLVEKTALDILKSEGFPVVKVIKVIPALKENDFRAILIEEYVSDEQHKKNELSSKQLSEMALFLYKIHKIKLNGYGPIMPNKQGNYKSWEEYILSSTKESLEYAKRNKLISLKEYEELTTKINLAAKKFKFTNKGSFIILDINPMNLFFKESKISKIIDVDHPIVGDPLYEIGSLRMYFTKLYRVYTTLYPLAKDEMEKVIFYEVIKRLNVLKWRHENNISIDGDLEAIRKIVKKMKSFI